MHNFIKKEDIADVLFHQYENEDITSEANNNDDSNNSQADRTVNSEEQMEMPLVRDAMVDAHIQK